MVRLFNKLLIDELVNVRFNLSIFSIVGKSFLTETKALGKDGTGFETNGDLVTLILLGGGNLGFTVDCDKVSKKF